MASGALLVGLLATAAGAVVDQPPGPYAGPIPPGNWIAFHVDPNPVPYHGTVTLSVVSGSTATTADLWGATGAWPTTWQFSGGPTLNQVSTCTVAQHPTSCTFNIQSPASQTEYQNLLFGLNLTPPQVSNFQQSVTFDGPPTTTTTQPPAPSSTFSGPGELTTPGSFTFTAPGQFGVTYTWTLFFNGGRADAPQTGTSYTPPAQIFNTPGTYTLRLTAAGPTGQSEHEVSFIIPPPQQAAPPPPPPQQPAPHPQTSLGFHPAAAPSFTQVSFTPHLADFSTPKPGAVQPVTVIWLWRPDWFQATANQKPKTAGRPRSVTRAAVSVGSNRGGPSATPWLAGLATFGIFGAAWLAVRRRRVRTSILD
jgi:PKD domain-containing protein